MKDLLVHRENSIVIQSTKSVGVDNQIVVRWKRSLKEKERRFIHSSTTTPTTTTSMPTTTFVLFTVPPSESREWLFSRATTFKVFGSLSFVRSFVVPYIYVLFLSITSFFFSFFRLVSVNSLTLNGKRRSVSSERGRSRTKLVQTVNGNARIYLQVFRVLEQKNTHAHIYKQMSK